MHTHTPNTHLDWYFMAHKAIYNFELSF